jgi:hypothetical protein
MHTIKKYFGSYVVVDPDGNFVTTNDGFIFETPDEGKAISVMTYFNQTISDRPSEAWIKAAFCQRLR